MKPLITTLAVLVIACFGIQDVAAQYRQRKSRREAPNKAEMQKKIEDLRKVKLLDLLDLQGDQVEKFFTVYNRYQKDMSTLRRQIEEAAIELQGALGNDASDQELDKLTKQLRVKITSLEKAIEGRFDDVRPILSAKQYAQYVVFEARFRDELQRMLLERMRRMRNR